MPRRERAGSDLLLLNFSNYKPLPIFPYAFTQLTALARRHKRSVVRRDFLAVPPDRVPAELAALVTQHRPRAIGLTVRQADSLMIDSYRGAPSDAFFPLEDTRRAIRALREVSTAPIIVGGAGFSIHPEKALAYLEADHGCVGCADDVIANLGEIAEGRSPSGVANLMTRDSATVTMPARTYFPPLDEREWDDALVDELSSFYGQAHMASEAAPPVPVEVMRGCPFRCYFCAEPLIKGKRWRTRDLEVVEAELEFLVSRGLRYFWFVASELNIEGADFPLALAELMTRLRERHPTRDLLWSGYLLPWKTTRRQLGVLQRSGYRLGWNDFQSFSDTNLRRTLVPYRMKDVGPFIEASIDPAFVPPPARPGAQAAPLLALFLGNAFSDASTISETLQAVDERGLHEYFAQDALLIPAVRIFALNRELTGATPESVRAFRPPGAATRSEADTFLLHPTFKYPPALLEALGDDQAYNTFLRYIGETFLSRAHVLRKEWSRFLSTALTREDLLLLLEGLKASDVVRGGRGVDVALRSLAVTLFDRRARDQVLSSLADPPPERGLLFRTLAKRIATAIQAHNRPALARVKKALGLGRAASSEYRLMAHLYARYESREALVLHVAEAAPGIAERFLLDKLLFENNVRIDPRYRALLFGRR